MIKSSDSFLVCYISNIQTSESFYRNIGAEIVSVEPDKLVIKLGSHDIHFVLDTTEPFESYQFAAAKAGRGQGTLFYVEVGDATEYFNLLTEKGLDELIISDPTPNHWDCIEFMVKDPDGFLIVFWSN